MLSSSKNYRSVFTHRGTRRYTEIFKGILRCTKIYRGIQKYAEVYRDIQRYTEVYRVYRDIQRYTEVYRDIQRYTAIYIYSSIQKNLLIRRRPWSTRSTAVTCVQHISCKYGTLV